MKIFVVVLSVLFFSVHAQTDFKIHKIKLTDSLLMAKNEFSGMAISGRTLFLLCQNKQVSGPWSGIYSVNLDELDKNITDTTYLPRFTKQKIINLNLVKEKTDRLCHGCYDGLEAIAFINDKVYLSVETKDFAKECFIFSGTVKNNQLTVDTQNIISLPKPFFKDGSKVCNSGFETMVADGNQLLVFFEANNFDNENYYYRIQANPLKVVKEKFKQLPFRLTDGTISEKGTITAINFFYAAPDEHCETIYRPASTDKDNRALVYKNGRYKNYARLIEFEKSGNTLDWRPLWTFPERFSDFNWEGVISHQNGFFVINDEFANDGRRYSELIFLERVK